MTAISFKHVMWSVDDILRRFPQLRLDPEYQREGNVWSLSRRQLFIDSVLNGFDSPKVYLHELRPPTFGEDSLLRFSVIDGRQRLEALRAFADGAFPLSSEFRLLQEDDDHGGPTLFEDSERGGRYADSTFSDLAVFAPHLARRFMAYGLSIVLVDTDDTGYIEELFFRLNEGAPLSSAEKRNRGDLFRESLRRVRSNTFFELVPLRDHRGRLNDLVTRMMFLVDRNATDEYVPDLRLKALNDFTAKFRPMVGTTFTNDQTDEIRAQLQALTDRVSEILSGLAEHFEDGDQLLRKTGDIMTYFLAAYSHDDFLTEPRLRDRIVDFFANAAALEGLDEEALSADEMSILDLFSALQGTTTGSYLAARAELLYEFVKGGLELPHGAPSA